MALVEALRAARVVLAGEAAAPVRLAERRERRDDGRAERRARRRRDEEPAQEPEPVPNSNLQLDFNVSVRECFDATSLASLRELDESNRFVQKSAESTSI